MDTQWNGLPTIDWELGKKLAGNQMDLAKDMIEMLLKNLPKELDEINQHYLDKNDIELLRCVHKLHGATAYCGTPRLKQALANLERPLKNHTLSDLPTLINQLNTEVNHLLDLTSL